MKVLIAEDDAASRKMLEGILRKWEYEVVTAADGTEAWRILTGKEAPTLAILDWEMPGRVGPDICRDFKQAWPDASVYFILLTQRGAREDMVMGLDEGADDYIVKPFDHAELKARLNVGRRVLRLQSSLTQRVHELAQALSEIKTLHGLLPICAHCKRIRDDEGYWQKVEVYLREHSQAQFSHSLCPECLANLYPEEE